MDVANFLGLKELNVALNVLLAVALVVVLVTLIETRIQLIGRIGKCAMSVRWSVGRLHGWSVGRSVGRLDTTHRENWYVCYVGPLVRRLFAWLVSRSVGRSVGWSVGI